MQLFWEFCLRWVRKFATSSPRHPATFTLSHFHTFLYAEQLLKNFTPLLGKNTPFPIHFTPTFGHKNADFSLA